MQVLAAIPPEAIRHALGLVTRGDRPLNYIEQGQIVLLVSGVRVKFGGRAISLGSPDISASTAPAGSAASPASTDSKIKIKMSQVIDQGCDVEAEQMSHLDLQGCRARYVAAQGDRPIEKEEITDAQLSALAAKVQRQMAPFTDTSVFGPYGDRLARHMKFTSHMWKDGAWKALEIPGGTNLGAWEESWRIFRTLRPRVPCSCTRTSASMAHCCQGRHQVPFRVLGTGKT